MFILPQGCLGFDSNQADKLAARERFLAWLHALASSQRGRVQVREDKSAAPRSFSAFELDGMGLWILHNHWTSVIGAVATAPFAGFAFAVDSSFERLEIPDFLRDWGPTIPSAADLNRELTDEHWRNVTLSGRTYADRFKPIKVSHVLFNYWD